MNCEVIMVNCSPPASRLQPSLSAIETWGFGFSGLLLWLGPAPAMHAALGPQAIFVWIPGVVVGMLLNFQVKALGTRWPKVSGGTPNYTTHLLEKYPCLAAYSAIGYFFGWAAVPLINAIILTDLVKANLDSVGLFCPAALLKVGFTLLAFVVALSGTRALGVLHLFFIIPALGLLLAFCLQGLGWLAFAPSSPGVMPIDWQLPSFSDWAKWFFIVVYAVYACETASSFVADSRRPNATLRCLSAAAWLLPIVYLGGSWVLMRLAIEPQANDSAFLSLLNAATPFWGESTSLLVTFLVASSCLLTCATGFSNSPRVLYQLAQDGYLAPVFGVVSRRGVLAPALIFTLLVSLTGIVWGDVSRVVMVTGTGYFCAIMATHLGLWLRRGEPEVKWPAWSLVFLGVECGVLIVGGLAWDWQDFAIGLLLPIAVLAINAGLRRLPWAILQPEWWAERDRPRPQDQPIDLITLQVSVLLLLVGGSVTIVWLLQSHLTEASESVSASLFVVLLLTLSFVSIGVACWTTLPQVIAIDQARERSERLLTIALDAILVLDQDGVIQQANPAADILFGASVFPLVGQRFDRLFPALKLPQAEEFRSQQTWRRDDRDCRTVEVSVSARGDRDSQSVIILHDITEAKREEVDRQQAETALRQSEAQLRLQTQELEQALRSLQKTQTQLIQTEKMSSLGQLVAGVAHEINNPINFIHGNVTHACTYTQDLLELVSLFQSAYPCPTAEIVRKTEDIDLEFLQQDLPKLLSSMLVGTDRIAEIVRSLRNFSRIDESEIKAVNLHDGIDSTLMILQSRLKETPERSAIQVVKQYGDLPLVECYAGQINQVFMNLLSNATDAIDEAILQSQPRKRGVLTITTIAAGNWVKIQISDNGLGMSQEVQQRLLDPFFTTKPIGKGTGLGMAISHQIVTEKHDGRLEWDSQPGQGTTFVVAIPVSFESPTLRNR